MSKVTGKFKSVDSLYVGKSTLFKIFLLGGVAIISALFIWYTFNLIEDLQEDTRSQVDKYVKLWQLAANSDMSDNDVEFVQFIFDEIIIKASFPIVVLDNEHNPNHYRNIEGITPGDYSDTTMARLKKVADEMIKTNGEFPLIFRTANDSFVNYFCYGDSEVIKQLKFMPFIQIGIIFAFMIVAIIGFQNIRRSEERHIWVGMAKETAHQLGTPISSLMGWLEVMDSEKDSLALKDSETEWYTDVINNMSVDVDRLQKVANRFGKIGSVPELSTADLNIHIRDAVNYYKRRLPFEGKGINLSFECGNLPPILLNQELFSWAIENMIKNALQAVDSKSGVVTLKTTLLPGGRNASLEINDNGKGISSAAARKIFRAGFTTKKRGWGLGLTLVKRIIEEYHGGRIYLKKSMPGETIFEIILPVENNKG